MLDKDACEHNFGLEHIYGVRITLYTPCILIDPRENKHKVAMLILIDFCTKNMQSKNNFTITPLSFTIIISLDVLLENIDFGTFKIEHLKKNDKTYVIILIIKIG